MVQVVLCHTHDFFFLISNDLNVTHTYCLHFSLIQNERNVTHPYCLLHLSLNPNDRNYRIHFICFFSLISNARDVFQRELFIFSSNSN